jgi:glucosylceramidase
MIDNIKGLGFQWEGGQILPRIRNEYPYYKYMSTESECGNGSMDWDAAEHTFHLINHYLGNGCSDYNNWNLILCDNGESPWGWRQNALIRVNSANRTFEYTPEYYTYRHYSNFITNGSQILTAQPTGDTKVPIIVALTPDNKYVIVAGNFNDTTHDISVKIDNKYLNVSLRPHSLNTLLQK